MALEEVSGQPGTGLLGGPRPARTGCWGSARGISLRQAPRGCPCCPRWPPSVPCCCSPGPPALADSSGGEDGGGVPTVRAPPRAGPRALRGSSPLTPLSCLPQGSRRRRGKRERLGRGGAAAPSAHRALPSRKVGGGPRQERVRRQSVDGGPGRGELHGEGRQPPASPGAVTVPRTQGRGQLACCVCDRSAQQTWSHITTP